MLQKMNLLENFAREGEQINPILLDIMSLVARNNLKQRRNVDDEFELLETSSKEETTLKKEETTLKKEETTLQKGVEQNNFNIFIAKIDEYIASITLEKMSEKPYFFLDYSDQNIQDYLQGKEKLEHILNNTDAKIIEETPILEKEKLGSSTEKININGVEKEIKKIEVFSQKKKFYDINTEFIAKEKIFNENNKTTIFYFQYLVNNLINKIINEYANKENLINQLFFIFKGGTTMKIIFEKYKSLMIENKNLFDNLNSFFGRSDSDYAVFLDENLGKEKYNMHYYKLNIIIYNCLKKINEFINNNLENILPLNTITNDDMKGLLNKYNKTLKDDKEKLPYQRELKYFDKVKEFIGLKIFDKVYIDETLLPSKKTGGNYGKFNLFMTGGEDVLDKFEITHALSEPKKGSKNGPITGPIKIKKSAKHKKKPIERQSFYVTCSKSDENKYVPNKYVSANVKINTDELQLYKSGIYQYMNETNRFIVSEEKNYNTYFTLHRVKINIILYYKTDNDTIGQFRAPAELIDVPITFYEDYKSHGLNFSNVIKKYIYTLNNKSLEFYSYSLYGFIDDIYKALYVEQDYPWDDVKYNKKINRVLFLLLIYCLNNFNNIDQIIDEIKKYTNDNNKTTLDIKYENIDGTTTNKHEILDKYINYNNDLKTRIKNLDDTEINKMNKAKYEEYKNYIDALFGLFKIEKLKAIETTKIPEDVSYLQKYLKYKHKYLSLKNKLYK